MASKPSLTVVGGTAASPRGGAFIPTGVVGPDGSEYYKGGGTNQPPPPGSDQGGGHGGGGNPMTDIEGLKKNVGFLNWAIGVMFVAGIAGFVGLYFLLSADIDGLRRDVGAFQTESARQFERVLVRLPNDQPQGGQREEPARPVREVMGGRTQR